ncbi:MAG TPA: tetratricopeptide repeat protein, partial [Thermoanaerobaculia bacterium]|nr:tetratricopeptide repeat protein [Thermoanaerobaculia bacterium]
FFPLAEELRKAGQVKEAERVLREGIERHPAYLSAWVSLGRLLSQQERHGEAVGALSRALQIDPENVVAARLAAESYLALGEKVEAIKKFKLVHAFIPSDLEVQASIEFLERQLNPEKYSRPIQVTEEIPEFRDVAVSPLPAGEGSGVMAPVFDPFNGPGSESATEIESEDPQGEVTWDPEELESTGEVEGLTELSPQQGSLTPDPSPAGRGEEASNPVETGPALSIVPDHDEQRQKTIEKLHRWLTLIQRNQRRND